MTTTKKGPKKPVNGGIDVPQEDKDLIVFQPNHITFSKTSFSLTQLKVFAFVMKSLQQYITPQVKVLTNNRPLLKSVQLEIFEQVKDNVLINIPKTLFVKGRNYKEFEEAIHEITSIPIIYQKLHPITREKTKFSTSLFSAYYPLTDSTKSRFVTIEIKKETLEILTKISIQSNDKLLSAYNIDNYTNYAYNIAMAMKGYYSHMFYIILSAWKDKEFWLVSLVELREIAGISPDMYKDWRDFRKRVLVQAQTELKDHADFHFDFEKLGSMIKFTLVTPKKLEKDAIQIGGIANILKHHYSYTDQEIETLKPILRLHSEKVTKILLDVADALSKKKKNGEKINSPKKYAQTALNTWYKNLTKKKKNDKEKAPKP